MSKKYYENKTNTVIIFILISVTLIVLGLFVLLNRNSASNIAGESIIQDGAQIVEINVKGGYTPSNIQAKAGVETYLKFKTNNTYDCSSSISIPSLGILEYLPSTGEKIYKVTAEQAQGELNGSCAMGHYRFTIKFV